MSFRRIWSQDQEVMANMRRDVILDGITITEIDKHMKKYKSSEKFDKKTYKYLAKYKLDLMEWTQLKKEYLEIFSEEREGK